MGFQSVSLFDFDSGRSLNGPIGLLFSFLLLPSPPFYWSTGLLVYWAGIDPEWLNTEGHRLIWLLVLYLLGVKLGRL